MTKSKNLTPSVDIEETNAHRAVDNNLNAAAVLEKYAAPFGEQDIMALRCAIDAKVAKIQGNDLQECEAMLYGQALALQSMFMELARRAKGQEYLKQYEAFFRLALKAQSQCRATLETLSALKNPQVVFAKQANITNGPQQVNNNMAANTLSRPLARQNISEPNELLEQGHEIGLDTGKAAKAIAGHQTTPTLAEINRSAKP